MEAFLLLSKTKPIHRLTFFYNKYVVIVLFLLEQIDHVHFVVINLELQLCKFNPDVMTYLWSGTMVERQKKKVIVIEWEEENDNNLKL